MDLRPQSDPESSVVPTDNAAVHPGVVLGLTRNIKFFVNPFSFVTRFFGGPRGNSELPEPIGGHIRSDSETRGRFMTAQTANHLVTNNYYISGGVGGAGGLGHGQGIGGGGGAGLGPSVSFYTPRREEQFDFRTIRFGDINLRKEIHRDRRYDVVKFESGLNRVIVRRVHSGEIRGDPGPVTVAIYQADRAEEEWRKHLAKYAAIRHPSILQLYGLVHTDTVRGMVFHDGADHYC
ncbi:hypothetical protein MSAN_01756600 [Mycena sanguinolenta]|uniref:Protein kinase domain-containing protein n=1 Tax=Mycena sanguinolenta TaxID=230812 RepID=A0A8H7CTU9_9AGAR|nr:hypothetical protein MSAN_01756600 [Mycena sanguinolenta]